jgi:hypothetical protein
VGAVILLLPRQADYMSFALMAQGQFLQIPKVRPREAEVAVAVMTFIIYIYYII